MMTVRGSLTPLLCKATRAPRAIPPHQAIADIALTLPATLLDVVFVHGDLMMPIFVQLPLAIAGLIAGYFVSRESLTFTLFQTAIALVMLAVFCALILNAPRVLNAIRSFRRKSGD